MDENALLKKIQQLVRDEIRPVKDLVEITKKKVDSQELYLHAASDNIRRVKEQQSLMNEKLDQHTDSLVTIETTLWRQFMQ